MKRILILGFILITSQISAQDYVMLGKTPLVINPAFTGINDFGRLSLSSNAFFDTKKAINPRLYSAFDSYIPKLHGGVVIYNSYTFYRNYYKNNQTGVSYAFQGKINDNLNYSIGAQGIFNQKITDWDKMNVICFDICPTGIERVNTFNTVLGGVIYSSKWFFGATYNFENESNFNLGYTHQFKKIDDLSLTTSLYLRANYGAYTYTELQAMVNYKMVYFGAKYNSGDSFAFQLGAKLLRFRLSYSFEINTSKLTNAGYNKHELSLQVKLPKNIKRNSNGFNHLIY
jgi:hypothetical protein